MKQHFHHLLQTQPFETLPRTDRMDVLALSLLVSGLILLMLLQFRNPSAIPSMLSRSFRETNKKLYFASAAIDSIDKLLFFGIYLTGGALCLHYMLSGFNWQTLSGPIIYFLPLILLVFLVLPLRITALVSGQNKAVSKILKRQLPVLFLIGVVFIPFGLLFYINFDFGQSLNFMVLGIVVILFVWIHIRVGQDLILEQIPMYYIFMYFCTLEILPIFTIWVWISRL
jgi:hypothetical protein